MRPSLTLCLFGLVTLLVAPAAGATLELKDGRILTGRMAEVAGVAEDALSPQALSGEVQVTPIMLVDDGVRRTYVHKSQIRQVLDPARTQHVKINLWQNVAKHGATLTRVGPSLRVTPFDVWGRRIYEMRGTDGPVSVVQGITQITPVETRVEGLVSEPRSIVWDMRLATSSIPRETLSTILKNAIPQDDVDARLQVVRLYLQSDRYRDARIELEQILEDFPERENAAQLVREVRQMGARMILSELQLRAKAGQHQTVRKLLAHFPSTEVAGETLQQVREMLAEYEREDAVHQLIRNNLATQVALLEDPAHRATATELSQEIGAQLSSTTSGRLASFLRLADDPELDAAEKVALAISGWLLGANDAIENFQIAISLSDMRSKVRAYLAEPVALERSRILDELRELEGASVSRVAKLLRLNGPSLPVPHEASAAPGYYRLSAAGGSGASDIEYAIQLPPEYDPLRDYPALVALNGDGYQTDLLMDFWAGPVRDDGPRLGQAMRRGYVTIVVTWQQPHQAAYEYSAREHDAVLRVLRDALRRFAIDSDRVFLTGHGIGGDAVWDIGLAHPDLWAGVIPFLAVGDRYCPRYWKNAEFVPWYLIEAEKDGNKIVENAREFDRYLRPKFDATVVEFQGRGHEPLGDEIQRLFDWMGRRQRRPLPTEFECSTMRPWDNFFWWLEAVGLPEKSMVLPENWPPASGARPARLGGRVRDSSRVSAFVRAARTTVWLAPEMVDFQKPITVELNGRRITGRNQLVRPDLAVLLEDVRTRGDRQHPFWAKVTSP